MTADDWALVAQARTDVEAFAELYRRHRPDVHRFVHARVYARHVDDITAETFTRALANLDRVTDLGRPFGAWLFTIARNIIWDHHKRQSTRREVLVGEFDETTIPTQRGHADRVDSAVDAARLMAGSFRSLAPSHRDVLTDRYLQELTLDETGARHGCAVSVVKARQNRALHSLRRQIGEVA